MSQIMFINENHDLAWTVILLFGTCSMVSQYILLVYSPSKSNGHKAYFLSQNSTNAVVCISHTQCININLHSNPPFSCCSTTLIFFLQ